MDRKTTSVLNGVVRELFEDGKTGIGVQGEGGPVMSEPSPPPSLLQKAKDEIAYQLANENTRRNWAIDDFLYRANKVNTAAQAVSDDAAKDKAAREAKDAMLQRIREHNPKTGPDPALGKKFDMDAGIAAHAEKHGDDPALGPHLNTYSNIRARNPEDPTAYDPALGELNPWYQRLGHWVGQNPGYAALAAGAPLALAAGAYYLKKRREGKK